MSPPNIFEISLQMYRPNPTPFVLSSFVQSRNPNNLNNLHWSSFFMPTPESYTETNNTPYFDQLIQLR